MHSPASTASPARSQRAVCPRAASDVTQPQYSLLVDREEADCWGRGVDIEEQQRAMVGVTARLVEFLRELARTGRPQVRDIDHHQSQMVRWLVDLPDQVTLDVEAGPGETLISLHPVSSEPAPQPPAAVAPWVEKADIENSMLEQPRLSTDVPDEEYETVVSHYEAWVDVWRVWAEADRLIRPRREWYEALARVARRLEQQDDVYELVVGGGLLTWSTGRHRVRYPLLTTRVDVMTDPVSGRLDVVIPEETGTRLGDRALLEGTDGFNATRAESIRDALRTRPARPLGDENKDLLSRWHALALERAHPYEHTWEPSELDIPGPDLRFAPVLILRERDRTSLIDYFDRMLEHLHGPDAVAPVGLAQLLTALEPEDRLAWLEQEGADDAATVGSDPLFPLPANPEQRQIIDRLRHDNGVAVLGPPGTGKTHTIANLISALLARGQRVLVTSQKAQALRVLRDKLPPELQQLCVSMTDVRRGGSRELDKSVTALSDRYGRFDRANHDVKVRRLTAEREAARRDVAELTERIRALRESETYVHPQVADGYEGTRARIAERLRQQASTCGWMPVPMLAEAPADPPLEIPEIAELRRLLASSTPEREARRHQVLPDMSTLPTAVVVAGLCRAEAAATAAARDAATDLSEALSAVGADDLATLRKTVDRAQAALHALGPGVDIEDHDDWRSRALSDGFARRELAVWEQLAELSAHARGAQEGLRVIGLRTVTLPPFEPSGPESLVGQLNAARALRDHLAAGNPLKRRFRPAVQRSASRLLDGATVDGAPVTNLELLDVVLATLEAEQTAAALTDQWAAVGIDIPANQPVRRRIAQIVDNTTALENILTIVSCRDEVEQQLAARSTRVPLGAPDEWSAFVDALAAVEARLEAERATAELAELVARLELEARSPTAAPELARLAAAVAARDPDSYGRHLERLAGAFAEQADQARCDELWAKLHGVHPVLADRLAATADEEAWDARLAVFDQAWAWGKARTFFDTLREPGLEDRLAADLHAAVDRVGRTTAALAAEEAWGQCLLRMTAHQERALRSYRSNIEALGRGTGKWAHRYAAAARQAMSEARDAVPAWIMPLNEVVETIPPDRNSFDVVIIDEASQASIEALFLLWLAPRVIVVGDERQCAPSQVAKGRLQPIFDRLDDYLGDVPEYLRLELTPRSNLFSLLSTRFGSVIRLREHFRCMPEIIDWSSRQFYADAPLVPLRQFGAERLPPLRTVYVRGAVTEGTSTRLRNVAEAEALVDKVVECMADPAYEGRDMGVVVLQGSAQVRLIEDLLEQRVSPEEWERRRLRVGTPPDFQGDERDVVFLSMVVADRRPAVTAREWQRRFNVAASRAKDQMWLFHSVTVDLLSVQDLRRSLLAYMLNPPAPLTVERYDDLTWDSDLRYPFESKFEQRVFIALRDRGYHVTPQFEVNGRRIDLVVTGAKGRLAVECDGDYWHSRREDQLADLDRELELRRAGWQFWRVRESEFYLDPESALSGLWDALEARGIRPGDLAGIADPDTDAPSTREEWEAAELADKEGLDGLEDDADPAELDEPGRRGSPGVARTAMHPAARPRSGPPQRPRGIAPKTPSRDEPWLSTETRAVPSEPRKRSSSTKRKTTSSTGGGRRSSASAAAPRRIPVCEACGSPISANGFCGCS